MVNPAEAAIVREIYDLYIQHQTLTAVGEICRARNYRSKINVSSGGTRAGGVLLKKASVRKLLMNPVYAGYLVSGGKLTQGLHKSIVDLETWERVAQIRAQQIAERAKVEPKELLGGLIYDCYGRSMTANRLSKRGKVYVAYRSNQSAWGTRHRVKRMGIRAVDADRMIVTALQDLLRSPEKLRSMLTDLGRSTDELSKACKSAAIAGRRLEAISRDQLRSILRCIITRVEVSRERVQLVTRPLEIEQLLNWNFVGLFRRKTEDTSRLSAHVMNIPCAGDVRLERPLRLPLSTCKGRAKQRSNGLRKLLSDARNAWVVVEENRGASPADLARTCKLSISRFMRLLRVNYLAPDILTAIMDGTQPPNLTRRELLDANLPLDWTLQRQIFGFPDQPPIRTSEQG